jgi:phosphate/sulfate permease
MGMASVVAGLKKMVSDKTLSNLKDYHLPIMVFMFLGGGVLAWFGKMTMAFVAFTGTIVGGITGHAFSPAQRDKDDSDVSSGTDSTPSGSSK